MVRHSWGQIFVSLLAGATVGAEVMALLHYYMGPHELTWKIVLFSPLLGLTYLIIMLPIALAVGFSAYLALAYANLLNGVSVLTVGALAGSGVGLLVRGWKLDVIAFMGFGGFVSSLVCWLILRSRSLDNVRVADA